jgi:1-acyl-sn-glycerol-3-phosphate acyltransferase
VKVPPWIIRRTLIVAAVLALAGLSLPLLAVTGISGALAAPLARGRRWRWRPQRVTAFAVVYLWLETVALATCLGLWLARPALGRPRYDAAHTALLGWVLDVVRVASERAMGFTLALEEPPQPFGLGATGPVLVACRHAGVGDSFLLVYLLLARYGRRPRVVGRDTMRLDPLIDVLLTRIGSCFVPSGRNAGTAATRRVGELAASLGLRDALLIFPEGGNFTPGRRTRAIEHLRGRGHPGFAAIAETMPHVLPPRPDGLLAAFDARPDAPAVVFAHTGLDDLISIRAVWRALPLDRPLRMRWWNVPAEEIPAATDEQVSWLLLQWAIVDEWIDARR